MKTEDIAGADDQFASRIAFLIAGYLRQSLTAAEHDELDAWLTSDPQNQLLFEELTSPQFLSSGLQAISDQELANRLALAKKQLGILPAARPPIRRPVLLALAACVVVLAGFFLYEKWGPAKSDRSNPVPVATSETIAPGRNVAVLTLSDGQQIQLDDEAGTAPGLQDTSIHRSTPGELRYSQNPGTGMHTLATPVGGSYALQLADGSRIWLNASSSVRYSSGFSGRNREVELSGEAYFEVAHQTDAAGNAIPFTVRSGALKVEVLGTRFDINAYGDGGVLKTSLLEGSVRSGSVVLHPGEQLRTFTNGGPSKLMQHQPLENEVSWKDRMFRFRDAGIVDIMQRLQRWYNVQVRYDGKINAHFNLDVSREEPLQKVLDLLSATKFVTFSLAGRLVTVHAASP